MDKSVIQARFRMVTKVPLIILLITAACPGKGFSQSVNVGVMSSGYGASTFGATSGYYPINNNNSSVQFRSGPNNRFNVGPTLQVLTPRRLALEVDVLRVQKTTYSRDFFIQTANTSRSHGTLDTVVQAWEIPVLAQLHSSNRWLGGFLSGGINTRLTHRSTHTFGVLERGYSPPFTESPLDRRDTGTDRSHGPIVAGGVEFLSHSFTLVPQLRYTRWFNVPVERNLDGESQFKVELFDRNQIEVVLGVAFRLRR